METIREAVDACMINGDLMIKKETLVKSIKLLDETVNKLISKQKTMENEKEKDEVQRSKALEVISSVLDINRILTIVDETTRLRFLKNYAILLTASSKIKDEFHDQIIKYANICGKGEK
ncbi:hypothetical protein I4U23_010667 [Adineta vaga]|nr:hypothetical protein I4U23_010667 [Adineta vaga]